MASTARRLASQNSLSDMAAIRRRESSSDSAYARESSHDGGAVLTSARSLLLNFCFMSLCFSVTHGCLTALISIASTVETGLHAGEPSLQFPIPTSSQPVRESALSASTSMRVIEFLTIPHIPTSTHPTSAHPPTSKTIYEPLTQCAL